MTLVYVIVGTICAIKRTFFSNNKGEQHMNRFEWFSLIDKLLSVGSGILNIIKNVFGGKKNE